MSLAPLIPRTPNGTIDLSRLEPTTKIGPDLERVLDASMIVDPRSTAAGLTPSGDSFVDPVCRRVHGAIVALIQAGQTVTVDRVTDLAELPPGYIADEILPHSAPYELIDEIVLALRCHERNRRLVHLSNGLAFAAMQGHATRTRLVIEQIAAELDPLDVVTT